MNRTEAGEIDRMIPEVFSGKYSPLLAVFNRYKALAFEKQQLDDAIFGRFYWDMKGE